MSVPAYQPGSLAGLHVRLTGDRLAVCRLGPHAGIPAWVVDAPGFMTVSRTAEEVSVVCDEAAVPAGIRHEGPFRLLQVAGPIPFEVVGLMADLSGTLARAEISVLPIATFDTDYVLVRDDDAERSVAALHRAGCVIEDADVLAGPGAPTPLAPGDGRWHEGAVLDRLATSTRVGVLLTSPAGRVRDANDTLLELLGCTREEVSSGALDLANLTWPEYEAADRGALAELRVRRVATPYEKEFRHCSGRRVPALVTGATHGRAEEPLVLWMVIDLAERRRAERALRESERQFRLLADAAPVLVWTAGPDEQRSFVNRRWLAFTGRPSEQELGWGWLESVHPDDRARARRTYEAAFAARQAFRIEYRLRRNDGQYRWVIDDGAPLDDRGAAVGFVGACVDVTGRRQAEDLRERLLAHERRARGEAERVSRLKDDFLGTLSHELRTPLNAILGWTQVLRRSHASSITPAGLDVIDRNARLLTRLVDDLLDMSRLVAGDMRLSIEPVHLRAVVEAAVASVRAAADARGVTIECDVSDTLPPVGGDGARLQQVAWNLLANAVKFTPAGGRVRIAAESRHGEMVLEVSDTGRGISPEYLPQVFDRFSQADSSAARLHGGLGIGLAIVRHLVELHGGTVDVESAGIGNGATFTVRLPIREQQARASHG